MLLCKKFLVFFFFKQKSAYDMRISDWSSDVCSSDLLEITDVNKMYLARNDLHVELMGRGYTWLDTGTHESLLDAADFIHVMQARQGLQIACPEEIAWRAKWINDDELLKQAQPLCKNDYGRYLANLVEHR